MTSMAAVGWEDNAFHSLHELLLRSLSDTSPATLARLHTLLIHRRADFSCALQEPPRDPRLKSDLSKGLVSIHGNQTLANTAFCDGVSQLCDLLHIHEGRAAALYNVAVATKARFGDASDMEACLHLYYSERECLLNCIDTMLTEFLSSATAPPESRRIVHLFMAEFLPHSNATHASTVTLPVRLTDLYRLVTAEICKIQSALEDDSTLKSTTCESHNQQKQMQNQDLMHSSHIKLATIRLKHLIREQHYFIYLLVVCAHRHGLSATEFVKLINLLQSTTFTDPTLPYLLNVVMAQLDHSSYAFQNSTSRFVLDESVYQSLRELLTSSQWSNSKAMGVSWLSWVVFLDLHAKSDSVLDSQVRTLVTQELEMSRRTWFSKFGDDADIFHLINKCLLLDSEKYNTSWSLFRHAGLGKSSKNGTFANSGSNINSSFIASAMPSNSDAPTEKYGLKNAVDDIRKDVSDYALVIIERLARCFVVRMRRYLRQSIATDQDIAASQESFEAQFSNQNSSGFNTRAGLMPEKQAITSWESLLMLLTNLYDGRSDAALDWFHHNDLFGFLKMGAEVWTSRFIVSFLDFLCAISTGPQCALQVHEILNGDQGAEFGQILWITFFRTLNSYIERLQQPVPSIELQPAETMLITAFLRLLGKVVTFSFTARRMLCENQHFRALHTLFQLLVSRIHVEMKASLFDAISAFCHPSEEGVEIVQQVWLLLEQSQIVPASTNVSGAHSISNPTDRRMGKPGDAPTGGYEGIAYDMFEVETCLQTYPETRAFLGLLDTLLSNPRSLQLTQVYENLGSPDRVGGIQPYMRFAIDDVLLRAGERPYADPAEKWIITESVLKIIDLAVSMLDMSEIQLPRDPDSQPSGGVDSSALSTMGMMGTAGGAVFYTRAPIRSLAAQPGFEVYCRILQGSSLTSGLFEILNIGVQQLDSDTYSDPEKLPIKSISSVLSIIVTTLAHQRVFLEILAPALIESGDGSIFNLPVSMVGLDQLLAYSKSAIVDIAVLINSDDVGVCLSSISIMSTLSLSPVFSIFDSFSSSTCPNRLLSVLMASAESDRILQGFVDRLALDEPEEHTLTNGNMSTLMGARKQYATDTSFTSDSMGFKPFSAPPLRSIRCAILDMLLANLDRSCSPNLAHFLLGYDCQRNLATTDLIDPSSPKGRVNCLHTILDLLSSGVSRQTRTRKLAQNGQIDYINDNESDGSDAIDPTGHALDEMKLSTTHPLLSEKCFHLVYLLCSSRTTGPPTMRYLRTREDFFVRQLIAMSPADVRSDAGIENVLSAPVIARLHQQAWIMRLITLELHKTSMAGQRTHMARLLNHLVGLINPDSTTAKPLRSHFDPTGFEDESEGQDVDYDQPLAKLVDILKSMEFSEPDRPPLECKSAAVGIDLDCFIRVNERGVDQYDVRAIYLALMGAVRSTERSTGIVSNLTNTSSLLQNNIGGVPSLDRESVKQLVASIFAVNEVYRLANARYQIAMSWGQLVRVSILDCIDMIPGEIRELRIFELLAGLLQKLSKESSTVSTSAGLTMSASTAPAISGNGVSMSIGKTLSEVVTGLMARLQQDDRSNSVLLQVPYAMEANKLDSWQHTILRGVLDGIVSSGTSLPMRGNYYSALVTYIQYISPANGSFHSAGEEMSGYASTQSSNGISTATNAIRAGSNYSATTRFVTSLSIITSYGDKLIETICRDAADGDLVWQTVAYATLASLSGLSNLNSGIGGRSHQPVLEFLARRNFLGYFVQSLKSVDDACIRTILGSAASNREGALNAKYVYDLKMSLFLKIAETKAGAERLIQAGVFEALSESLFIDERSDYGSYDHDLEQERYHDVVVPVLQLILLIQSHYPSTHAVLRAKISRFIDSHRDVVAAILRDKTLKITLSSMMQIRLMTGIVVWLQSKDEFLCKKLPGPGQSSIEDLMLNLLHKYVLSSDWRNHVIAVNDVEEEKSRTVPAKVLAPVSAMSVFAIEVETLGEQIAENLLSYWIEKIFPPTSNNQAEFIQASAIFTSSDQRNAMTSRAVTLLQDYAEKLIQAISRRKIIQMKAGDISQVPVDEVNEIAQSFNRAAFEELSPSQRQMLALRDLQNAERLAGNDIKRLYYVVEMASLFLVGLIDGSKGKSTAAAASSAIPVLEKLIGVKIPGSDQGEGFLKLCMRCLA
ncbi:hypothetical protein MT418_003833 [Batrachochytrium dendrobatidis]